MATLIRYGLALGVALIICALTIRTPISFAGGWWAACAWLVITRQWRPFATGAAR